MTWDKQLVYQEIDWDAVKLHPIRQYLVGGREKKTKKNNAAQYWPEEHGGPMNASTLCSTNNLMMFPVVVLLLHAESYDTKLQRNRTQLYHTLLHHCR